ncbi:MAG: hypothetical protein IRZ11_01795 [Clostridia bacterium]|nr:hypothetical protein [Clostridia bacterium]
MAGAGRSHGRARGRNTGGGPKADGPAARRPAPELPPGAVLPKGARLPADLVLLRSMRLDAFLQVSGLVRRRASVGFLCRTGRVRRNGEPTRPAARVRPGDVVEIHHASRDLAVRVNLLAEWWPAGRERLMYQLLHEVRRPEFVQGDVDPDLAPVL